MALVMFMLFLIAIPFYLLMAVLIIGGTMLLHAFPIVIALYLLFVAVGLLFLPIKPFYEKHIAQINNIGPLVGLILFGPLVGAILFSIVAFPFVMIYSLADNPFIWFSIIAAIVAFNIYYHNYRTNA